MIKQLTIRNFVIVEDQKIDFGPGLNVLTGETGAGKSVILGALKHIFSLEPANTQHLLNPNQPAYLEAEFTPDTNNKTLQELLSQNDLNTDDEELFFAREISTAGRSRHFINGRRVSSAIVTPFAEALLDFNSQRDQALLFRADFRLDLLDAYTGHEGDLNKAAQLWEQTRNSHQSWQTALQESESKKEKFQLYTYQLQELSALAAQPNEDTALEEEEYLLENSKRLLDLAGEMQHSLYDSENSIYDQLNDYCSRFEDMAKSSSELASTASFLRSALDNLDDAVAKARQLPDLVDMDAGRLEQVQQRLDALNQAKNKYHKEIPELIEYQKQVETYLGSFKDYTQHLEKLEQDFLTKAKSLVQQALKLSQQRRQAAVRLSKQLVQDLHDLALKGAKFEIVFDKQSSNCVNESNWEQITKKGLDNIDFYFSANPGRKPLPLKQAVSGGELSRLLLAFKKVLADKLPLKSIVFDEIDTGIGGGTALKVADYIKDVATNRQVLCITHLPQVASRADDHFAIVKQARQGSGYVTVNKLLGNNINTEIARMLSGEESEVALAHAEELLSKEKQ